MNDFLSYEKITDARPEFRLMPSKMTDEQRAKLFALIGQIAGRGVHRVNRLYFASVVLGRTVESWKTLTENEASTLIEHCQKSLTLVAC